MTGRELIIYILENGLEDEPIIKDGTIVGYKTVGKVAEEIGFGEATVIGMIALGEIEGAIMFGGRYIIPANYEIKRKDKKE